MPEMNEKELEAMEQRCEATKAARQQLEADNDKLDLELMDAKAQLAKAPHCSDDSLLANSGLLCQHHVRVDCR